MRDHAGNSFHGFTTDRYGRSEAELFRGGHNLNQALVAAGAAFVYWQYISGCDRNTYSRWETEARLRRMGVWSRPGWDGAALGLPARSPLRFFTIQRQRGLICFLMSALTATL